MFNKIKLYLTVGTICIIICLLSALLVINNNYKHEKQNRQELETQLLQSKDEINKLIQYNNKLNQQIQKIDKDYNDRLQNIPIDECGNAMPSQELLQFFKEGIKQ